MDSSNDLNIVSPKDAIKNTRLGRTGYSVFLCFLLVVGWIRSFAEVRSSRFDILTEYEQWSFYDNINKSLGIVALTIGIAFWFVLIRRLHDFSRSGWWVLLVIIIGAVLSTLVQMIPNLPLFFKYFPLLPFFFLLLVFAFIPSTPHTNKFGEFEGALSLTSDTEPSSTVSQPSLSLAERNAQISISWKTCLVGFIFASVLICSYITYEESFNKINRYIAFICTLALTATLGIKLLNRFIFQSIQKMRLYYRADEPAKTFFYGLFICVAFALINVSLLIVLYIFEKDSSKLKLFDYQEEISPLAYIACLSLTSLVLLFLSWCNRVPKKKARSTILDRGSLFPLCVSLIFSISLFLLYEEVTKTLKILEEKREQFQKVEPRQSSSSSFTPPSISKPNLPKANKADTKSTVASSATAELKRAFPLEDWEACKEALRLGADPNQTVRIQTPVGYRDFSLLMVAAYLGDLELIRLTVSAGAKVDALTDAQVTPLYMAIMATEIYSAELLLELGANPNIDTNKSNKEWLSLYNSGIINIENKNYKTDYKNFIEWFRKAPDLNHVNAYKLIADMYRYGKGIQQNLSKALVLYQKAANLGNINAMCCLGEMYSQGEGQKSDFIQAIKWYSNAAKKGHAKAEYQLGLLYEEGLGVEKNYAEALNWYYRASSHSTIESELYSADALSKIADMYQGSNAVEYDSIKAERFLKQAVKLYLRKAKDGNPYAQYRLGTIYQYNTCEIGSDYEAFIWHKKSAEQDCAEAQYDLAYMYRYEIGVEDKDSNYQEAVNWYAKAAEQGLRKAQKELTYIYESGNGFISDRDALKWYLLLAENNDADALLAIGDMYSGGIVGKIDKIEAQKWYTKAFIIYHRDADNGNAHAQNKLGTMYEGGKGIDLDYGKAREWYLKSSEQEYSTDALLNLGNMYLYGRGVKKNEKEATNWYRKAAQTSYADNLLKMGDEYFYGKGVKQNYSRARKYYKDAAEAGSAAPPY